MSAEAFNQLRTQEQLGYIVQLGLVSLADSVIALSLKVRMLWLRYPFDAFSAVYLSALAVQVQSANASLTHLVTRTDAFLLKFREHLAGLSADAVAAKAAVLSSRILESDKTPGEEASRLWGPILSGTLEYHTSEATAAAVSQLSKADVIAFYDACVMPGGTLERRLAAGVYSTAPAVEPLGAAASQVLHGGGPSALPPPASPPVQASCWLVPSLLELGVGPRAELAEAAPPRQ